MWNLAYYISATRRLYLGISITQSEKYRLHSSYKANSFQRTNPKSSISTTLYTSPSSIEYTTRVAKIVTRRIGVPVYVGCSIDPNGLGLEVEEEMEGLKKVVDVISERYESSKK